jgi:hypothetical protein
LQNTGTITKRRVQRRGETAQLENPNFARDAVKRLRVLAINKTLSRPLAALDPAVAQNGELIRDIVRRAISFSDPRPSECPAAASLPR